ncbi:MAG TPA: 4-carboxymuconolactone decarboxylase, partial [Alteromonas sp.]|nr:4-carboxymuconolactone decarboxylase [Alteromonas sp.]
MASDNPKYQQGMAVRREVMGDEFVDRALNSAS